MESTLHTLGSPLNAESPIEFWGGSRCNPLRLKPLAGEVLPSYGGSKTDGRFMMLMCWLVSGS